MILKKIKAGSLQLVTFITVVIALLLGCFILLVYAQKQFRVKTYLLKDTIQSIDKGMSYALQNNTLGKDSIALILDNDATVNIKSELWGTYLKIGVTSRLKNFRYKKTALIGAKQLPKQTALYLKENNKALVLVGHTKISGECYLPKHGVKSGNISGQSYNGNQFIDGTISVINKFPKLNFQVRNYIQNIHSFYDSNKSLVSFAVKPKTLVSNSFENPTIIALSSDTIYLEDISLTGNIVIQSYSKISVSHSAKLKDVILIAPKIEIEEGVKATFQAFASEHIFVGNNCELQYPSALVLVKPFTEKFEEEDRIQLNSNSKLQGNIIILGLKDIKNYNPQVAINAGAIVEGEIYCEQTLELKGKVLGTVFTDNFIARANGAYYQNHLLNAEINAVELNNEYVGLPIVNHKKGVAKWLY